MAGGHRADESGAGVEGSRTRRWSRLSWRVGVAALALYGTFHLGSTLYLGYQNRATNPPARPERAALRPDQQRLVSALTRLLAEDDVQNAQRWAEAIVRAAPTEDLGYIALVTAQVRRESHFLATDLEWLFERLVPQLVHELGVPDPIRTIGPMQVQRWRLQDVFERTLGRDLVANELETLAADIELGVAACVAVLDPIVRDHFPDRRLTGFVHSRGAPGLVTTPDRTLARDWLGTLPRRADRIALWQKLLSDVTRRPLALDGVLGARSREVSSVAASALSATERERYLATEPGSDLGIAIVARLWEAEHGHRPPDRIHPRITHDPRLAFVFADFHAGRGASRTAALQLLLHDLVAPELRVDGKFGPRTRTAMRSFFERFVADEPRRADFLTLIDTGHKPRWVREQAFDLAAAHWRMQRDTEPRRALVPDLWHDGFAHQVKGVGRISIEGYVAGSTDFYEDYLLRLALYTGTASTTPPGSPR